MRKIKGFTFEGEWVEESLNYIETEIGRKLTEEEEQEVGTLWNWNYADEDCVEMIMLNKTATEYDKDVMEDF